MEMAMYVSVHTERKRWIRDINNLTQTIRQKKDRSRPITLSYRILGDFPSISFFP